MSISQRYTYEALRRALGIRNGGNWRKRKHNSSWKQLFYYYVRKIFRLLDKGKWEMQMTVASNNAIVSVLGFPNGNANWRRYVLYNRQLVNRVFLLDILDDDKTERVAKFKVVFLILSQF